MSLLAQDTAERNMAAAAEFLNKQDEWAELREPEQFFDLSLDIGGTAAAEVLAVDELRAYVVVHSTLLGRPRGGQTWSPHVTPESVRAKGVTMTPKNAIDPDAAYTFGSGKTGVRVPESYGAFMRDMNVGRAQRLTLVRDVEGAFIRAALGKGAISPDIGPRTYTFAPDEGTNGLHMAAAVEVVEAETGLWVPAIATAKPVGIDPNGEPYRKGGVEGRNEATGRGLVDFLRWRILNSEPLMEKIARGENITVGLDGFGGVGSWIYETLKVHMQEDPILSRCTIAGIADATGTYYDENGVQVMDFKTLRGIEEAEGATPDLSFASRNVQKSTKDSRDVLTMDVDVLLVASIANRICSNEDLQEYPAETRFGVSANRIKAKYLIEGGNGSITYRGQEELTANGVVIDTGIGANSAGAAISWDEHNFGLVLAQNPDTPTPTLDITRAHTDAAMERRAQAVEDFARTYNVSHPQAAYILALSRLLEAA
jgi:glutamate dehydrogenase (NAD(P)+)